MTRLFESTSAFEREYKSLFDFIGASTSAIWTMRWQVHGYVAAHPNAGDDALAGYFLSAPNVGKFDFGYFRAEEWSTQEQAIARMGIINVIALYERWAEGIDCLTTRKASGRSSLTSLGSLCMGNSATSDPDYSYGVSQIHDSLDKNRSDLMFKAFSSKVRSSRLHAGSELRKVLVAYRAFKELRNGFMHRSELPDPSLINRFNQLDQDSVGLTYARNRGPHFPVVQEGVKPKLELKHAYFACHVIKTLVQTFDSELALTSYGAEELLRKVRSVEVKRFQTPRSVDSLAASVGRYIIRFGLPEPVDSRALLKLLQDAKAIQVDA
ncbi:hypothetical protein [Lentzea flaviverrucosa]|uniref:Uncharacterized protein n=1 Tax=Lentzea flaviverrucosa TaxID=200379 RepID=A0A1H9XYQ2_9PSEU|nr:hypothetical protein [Lentzea flaviverrucosa]RDI16360.1 hypothetical protein DFR72_12616 [Lentzea flaviverrucosa]SES51246.1 hypothetical protein SAMN05216195_1314 [Lentzea flaviverrucosa]